MPQKFLALLTLLSFFNLSNTYADARLIIHLTDYLANDYAGAVSEDQKVLSEGEFAEQKEFSSKVLEEGKTNSVLKDRPELIQSLILLNDSINKKSPPSAVIPLARKIQKDVMALSGISLAPANWPDYDKARKLYMANCIQCHGASGKGDGPDAMGLDPAPANFHDLSRAPIVSPFAAFNTIRLGVPGTGMGSYPDLSDEEVWSLSFYVSSIRFGEPTKSREALSSHADNEEILAQAASSNDEQFKSYALLLHEEPESFLKKVRLYFFESSSTDYLGKAKDLIRESVAAFNEGKHEEAQNHSLNAYFLGIEPVENKINANDSLAVSRIEEQMAGFRKAIKDKDQSKIQEYSASLNQEISGLQALLTKAPMTPAFGFLSGFSIILREGFEAVLVILAILGVAKAAASPAVTMAVHSGWIISLILGVIGWYASGALISMSGVSREVMEAIASFFAVFVLIYVGFWMHRQTEIHRWKEFINVRVKNLTLKKNLIGLFILSFVVTFREVFETVLFLRTVYLDSHSGTASYIFGGVVCAFVIVLIVSILITKFRNKIPLQKFFALSSVLMMFLATVLTGKGVHSLQEAGIVSMNSLPVKIRIELLGIYPSWESLLAQAVILISSILIWKNASKRK